MGAEAVTDVGSSVPNAPDGAEWVNRKRCYGLRCKRTGTVYTYNMVLRPEASGAWAVVQPGDIPDLFRRYAMGALRQWKTQSETQHVQH